MWTPLKAKINVEEESIFVLFQHGLTSDRIVAQFFLLIAEEAKHLHVQKAINEFYATSNPERVASVDQNTVFGATAVSAVSAFLDNSGNGLDQIQPSSIIRFRLRDKRFEGQVWNANKQYEIYCSYLRPIEEITCGTVAAGGKPTACSRYVSARDISYQQCLKGWRSSSALVQIKSTNRRMVYKGVSFFDFLSFGPAVFQEFVAAVYRDIRHIHGLIPHHPNIMHSAYAFVTVDDASCLKLTSDPGSMRISGCLYPFYAKTSLAAVIDASVDKQIRLSLIRKAKWCYQLVSALEHIHYNANSWHQDIKPPNALINDDDDLLMIDFEQAGACAGFLAPEADGSLEVCYQAKDDLENVENSSSNLLMYLPYQGPPRINNNLSHPPWIVFADWKIRCPRAVELAEVYSAGRMMFLLLEQVKLDSVEGMDDYESVEVQWSSASNDIPEIWKDTVRRCQSIDPNLRPGFAWLKRFWKIQYKGTSAGYCFP